MIAIKTYGCTFNASDTLTMAHLLGNEVIDNIDDADIVIFNTCGVKGQTQHKVIKDINALIGIKKIIVAGCLPLIDFDAIPIDVMAIIGPEQIYKIREIVDEVAKGGRVIDISSRIKEPLLLEQSRHGGTVAIMPISLGCLGECSYCATKFARGTLRSYAPDDIVKNVEAFVNEGYKEIQLTSQDTGCYGHDIGTDLPSLIKKICSIEGDFRLRVGMLNPNHTLSHLKGLIEAYKDPKVYKFLHLPVQSGSNRVLGAMKRRYSIEDFHTIVTTFRNVFPDMYLATDIIVGFPEESEEEFAESYELVKNVAFDKVNITRYSARPNTLAAKMKQFPDRIKKDRSRAMSSLVHSKSDIINRSYIGKYVRVLVTNKGKKGRMIGRLDNYKPIICDGEIGTFKEVKVVDATSTYLIS